MKHSNFAKISALTALILTIGSALSACNEKTEETEENQPSFSVAVRTFKLQPDARVMPNLDSVYFAIDLDRGVIFNADSLPMGTSIEKLIPVITFPNTVETAEIIMTGGSHREGTINYKNNPTDTVDFTGNVVLRLTAQSGTLSRDYRIKINVHKSVADSLMWDHVAFSALPSRLEAPVAQKTAQINHTVYTIITEKDGTHTLATTDDISSARWNRTQLNLSFSPDVKSFAASSEALYMLDDAGRLMTSTDGLRWSDTGTVWHTILGGYGDALLGISGGASSRFTHDIYPRPAGFVPEEIPSGFPTEKASSMLQFSSRWAQKPYAFLCGGMRDGQTLRGTWAYDGDIWSQISNAPLPPLSDALLVPYFVYRKTSASWIQTEYSVVLCIGGRTADGQLSRTVYLSYDNGVNWVKAGSLMQLPDFVPALAGADAVIFSSPMQSSLTAWQTIASPQPRGARIQYFVDGSSVEWECPYIYMLGGEQAGGTLNDKILRAVLARLTFTPLF